MDSKKAYTIQPGDRITSNGYTFTVSNILYQDTYARAGETDIEFTDNNGKYHHWIEYLDGGFVTKNI